MRGIKCVGNVARIEEIRNLYDLLVGIARDKIPFGRAKNVCRDILILIFTKSAVGLGTVFIWHGLQCTGRLL